MDRPAQPRGRAARCPRVRGGETGCSLHAARRHRPLLDRTIRIACILASETAEFQDSAHFPTGLVPGDGMHIVYPLLLGTNRGRYFLLTGQIISARQAQELGLVGEVLPKDRVLARAWELAEQLAKQPLLTLRYARVALTMDLKRRLQDLLGYGLALEGLASLDTETETK